MNISSQSVALAAMICLALIAPSESAEPILEGGVDSFLGSPLLETHTVFEDGRFPNVVVTAAITPTAIPT